MGMFHLGMKIMEYLLDNFDGRSDGKDPFSIRRFAKMFGDTRIKKEMDAKDFRNCHFFIEDMLDGLVIGACMALVGAESIKELREWLEKGLSTENVSASPSWRELVRQLANAIFSSTTIQKLRYNSETGKVNKPAGPGPEHEDLQPTNSVSNRNVPFENSLLFMRDVLMYKEFWSCIRVGNTGRLVENLKYW